MQPTDAMTDRDTVDAQYARTDNLRTRRDVWGPGPEGVSPTEVLVSSVVAARPAKVIEIGCGTGHFARSVIDALPDVDYLATDISAAMVEATSSLGVPSRQVPGDALPFADDTFDGAVAAWMLYHVPDLDGTLAELRRVLRDGGRLSVATNGEEHLGDLLREAGGEPVASQFTAENAEEALSRHFEHVSRRDVETRATFPDHAAAVAYLSTFAADLAAALPHFEGPRAYVGRSCILTAH
ncbi:class I SAM-dependent methyltransferase [Intrasporangium flavum]|uniref:class I SAM-dependent methyltransferase n=1 Tax=Intrasporangium flavum TaxID=1428657 RepID=UPI00096F1147|nr:class I SAM-dependent methyltransferase [Intrasporangium flavum]